MDIIIFCGIVGGIALAAVIMTWRHEYVITRATDDQLKAELKDRLYRRVIKQDADREIDKEFP